MDSKIIVNHFAPDQSIEDSLKFLEGDGEVANEDMGALKGDDVEGVDRLQGAAALVPTSTSTESKKIIKSLTLEGTFSI